MADRALLAGCPRVLTHPIPLWLMVMSVCSEFTVKSIFYTHHQWSWGGVSWFCFVRLSVCPPVRPSVCRPNRVSSVFSTILARSISNLHILSTNFRRCVTCQAFERNLKFEFLLKFFLFHDFWTVTPVWVHQWLQNDAQSLKQHRTGALLFFKVIHQISRSHGTEKWPILTRIERFQTVSLNSLIALKWWTNLNVV